MRNSFSKTPNFNLVRLIACFLVVLHHVIAYFEIQKGIDYLFLKTFSNTCVPLFILLSGALLIPKNDNYIKFFKKRFKSIFIPFLFWITFYSFLRLLIEFFNNTQNTSLILKNLFGIGGYPYYHLWYVYLIVFLYLITPLLRKSIKVLPEKYILFTYVILFFIFQVISIKFNKIFWSDFVSLYIMGGLISQIFSKNKLYFAFFLLSLSLFFIFENNHDIQVTSFSILLFLIMIKIPLRIFWIDFFIPLTLGVYLLHPLVLKLVTKNYFFQDNISLLTCIVFILTLFCVFLIKKISFLKRIF